MINEFLDKIKITSKLTRVQLEKFVKKYQSDGYTLDIGCAHSPYSQYFSHRVGLDIKPGPGVDVVGDVYHLPFKDEQFDNILCTEVLEHLPLPQTAISEMTRVLKIGGLLI